MKFGVALPYVGARAAARMALAAEESGWDGCFMGDAIWCEDPMIALAAAATATSRIRLGTMITPVPLRRPWKLASEAIALDRLSGGRMTLGLGPGAVWMGWQAFPDEVTDNRARAEMLDETIDILTLLDRRQPFDFEGKHYHLKLTRLDPVYYPPAPVQQPRIPLWCVGAWPRLRSVGRTLKCDGIILEKRSQGETFSDPTPADLEQVRAYVSANRTLEGPFDYVVNGKTAGLSPDEAREKLLAWRQAGLTWWIEGLWDEPEEATEARIRRGPPGIE